MSSVSIYRTFSNNSSGGKEIAVLEGIFDPAQMQERASSSGVPLTVFITEHCGSRVNLKIFTPKGEKGESDSGALAALFHLFGDQYPLDVAVIMSETLQARCNEGMWWLEQGTPMVDRGELDLERMAAALNASPDQIHPQMYISSTGRPKLLVVVPNTQILDALRPDYAALQELNVQIGSSGVIVLTTHTSRAKVIVDTDVDIDVDIDVDTDVDIRFFMPQQSKEDNAGANTAACVLGYLGVPRAKIAQGYAMRKPSSLFARDIEGRVWVAGMVSQVK